MKPEFVYSKESMRQHDRQPPQTESLINALNCLAPSPRIMLK